MRKIFALRAKNFRLFEYPKLDTTVQQGLLVAVKQALSRKTKDGKRKTGVIIVNLYVDLTQHDQCAHWSCFGAVGARYPSDNRYLAKSAYKTKVTKGLMRELTPWSAGEQYENEV